ncbi:hypothetical protein CCR94_10605 [Rhodoblastus sphagnicola]|uniref:Uncharacterized protein n=1 Tax=Rhodoblastus sphagnicola TaxID=333368 RepID=A0A2S6N8T1_9HYPH|nr:hypothetical protein [Rhodoblastus sphagnicola]MBB4201144.1 hypothetical protein [Rhodoblastus sphagnicola]PPQ31001.1 hypothetical protein CCR94_10605 [Rhodoblastus sphagnicola]
MSRAWELAREAREETARKAFDLDVRVVGARIIHNRPLTAFIAEIPLDLSAAQKRAWAEAKGIAKIYTPATALVIVRHGGALAPLRRRFSRVWPLLITAARWINSRFIPSRAA